MINAIPTNSYNYQLPESQVERPDGFQGSSKDTFVRDPSQELEKEKSFREMGQLFLAKHKHDKGGVKASDGGQDVAINGTISYYPDREGYKEDFLGQTYAMPTLGDSIKDKASHLIDNPDEIVLKYNHFSIVHNKERKQCFFTACNIDGHKSRLIKRGSDAWKYDGRIPKQDQLGEEAYSGNEIDRGHMVRRLDPAWGNDREATLGSDDTFVYTNSTMQHGGLNKGEWLQLEDHVLNSAKSQRMTVLTGPVFSDNDRTFNNHGRIKRPIQIPEKFWKVVVWKDKKTDQLKTCAFVLSQSNILDKDKDLFKGGFQPGKFGIYQIPIAELEAMTDLHFGAAKDITPSACRLDEVDGCQPQGL